MNEILFVLKNKKEAFCHTKQAIISVSGQDAEPFLNRLATNDVSTLFKQKFLQTPFTNNKGRMIDHCFLFAKTDQEILLVSSHQDPLILLSWLEQFHFVENLSIEDKSNHYIFSYGLGNGIHNTAPTYPICASKFLTHEDITIVGTLADHTAHTLSLDAWESLRIMCMLPKSPNEINDGMMPQNINLTSFISETKGCFIGQEVIAKARTYQKHVKTLSGIAVEEDVFKLLRSGLNVINSDGQTGEITSVAPFYVPGEVNALLLCDFSATRARVADALTINATFHCKT